MADKEITFKEIWNTLHGVDVSKHTEKKMNLTYLSWARAWMLLMEHFPQAEYSFVDYDGLPYRVLPDGTAEVITRIKIDNHTRSMALPIMDYKNNPVVNPNARQVNDNRMRCLVKNLAMFGLGMSVFAVWDDHLPSEEKDAQPKSKKDAKVKEKESTPVENNDFDLDWAKTFVEGMSKSMDLHSTKESLTSFWKSNKEAIGRLTSDFPHQKKELENLFKTKAVSVEGQSETKTEE